MARKIDESFYKEECVLIVTLDNKVLYQSKIQTIQDYDVEHLKYPSQLAVSTLTSSQPNELSLVLQGATLWETREIATVPGKITSVAAVVHDNPDLDNTSKELYVEEVRSELQDLAMKLPGTAAVQEDVAEDTTGIHVPIMLEEHLEKQHYMSLGTVSVHPIYRNYLFWSESGFADKDIEPPERFEYRQFLLDLAMKNEALDEEIQRLTMITRL